MTRKRNRGNSQTAEVEPVTEAETGEDAGLLDEAEDVDGATEPSDAEVIIWAIQNALPDDAEAIRRKHSRAEVAVAEAREDLELGFGTVEELRKKELRLIAIERKREQLHESGAFNDAQLTRSYSYESIFANLAADLQADLDAVVAEKLPIYAKRRNLSLGQLFSGADRVNVTYTPAVRLGTGGTVRPHQRPKPKAKERVKVDEFGNKVIVNGKPVKLYDGDGNVLMTDPERPSVLTLSRAGSDD